MSELTLAEYATRHGISAQRARALATQGRISARKIGSQWIVTDSSSLRVHRLAGRPPLAATVWAGAFVLEQQSLDVAAVNGVPARRRAVKQFLTRLASQPAEARAQVIVTWAANRGELHHVRAADAVGLVHDPHVARSGLAWPGSLVQSVEDVDVYVHAALWPALRADHALVEVPQSRANARVRVVADDIALTRDVPALIAAADLVDVGSPRARVAAAAIVEALRAEELLT